MKPFGNDIYNLLHKDNILYSIIVSSRIRLTGQNNLPSNQEGDERITPAPMWFM